MTCSGAGSRAAHQADSIKYRSHAPESPCQPTTHGCYGPVDFQRPRSCGTAQQFQVGRPHVLLELCFSVRMTCAGAADGYPADGLVRPEIISLLRGPASSPLVLTISRQGFTHNRAVYLERRTMTQPPLKEVHLRPANLKFTSLPRYWLLHFERFLQGCTDEIHTCLRLQQTAHR